mmetsp:Transcript_764/g.2180  ORF Transcript_764/g.2180 Transcript_764/m.2180 type:complete len:210 (+) Transcript_764:1135-1764(+)
MPNESLHRRLRNDAAVVTCESFSAAPTERKRERADSVATSSAQTLLPAVSSTSTTSVVVVSFVTATPLLVCGKKSAAKALVLAESTLGLLTLIHGSSYPCSPSGSSGARARMPPAEARTSWMYLREMGMPCWAPTRTDVATSGEPRTGSPFAKYNPMLWSIQASTSGSLFSSHFRKYAKILQPREWAKTTARRSRRVRSNSIFVFSELK